MRELKLLIVDDERATRNGLKKAIQWRDYDIFHVREAQDGQEALEICLDYIPDILITDIRMPIIDGIELATEITKKYPRTKIIFLSGYSDKAYLKAAIHLGVVNYVEKPIDMEELKKAILRAKTQWQEAYAMNRIQENPQEIYRSIIESLIRNKDSADKSIQQLLQMKPDLMNRRFYQIYIAKMRQNQSGIRNKMDMPYMNNSIAGIWDHLTTETSAVHIIKDDYHHLTLVGFDNSRFIKEHFAIYERVLGTDDYRQTVFVGVSSPVHSLGELAEAYQSGVIALQDLFIRGFGHISSYSEMMRKQQQGFDSERFLGEFTARIQGFKEKDITEYLRLFFNNIRMNMQLMPNEIKNISMNMCLALYNEAEKQISLKRSELESNEDPYLWERIYGIETMDELRNFVHEEVSKVLGEVAECTKYSKNIRDVMNYIEEHYMEPELSTSYLADMVYLTNAYLSTLFKKECGITISRYIQQIRIEKSRKLLMDKSMSLSEVAGKVGYTDPNYYAKTFKKHYGQTPSDYREKIW